LTLAVQTVWNNGGSSASRLAYELDAEDEAELQADQLDFETTARAPGTQTLDNLVPYARFKKICSRRRSSYAAKMLSQYMDVLTASEFRFKTLPDVNIQDHEKPFSTTTRTSLSKTFEVRSRRSAGE
jgi:hypothetical protein